jgi:hypothetical protein
MRSKEVRDAIDEQLEKARQHLGKAVQIMVDEGTGSVDTPRALGTLMAELFNARRVVRGTDHGAKVVFSNSPQGAPA